MRRIAAAALVLLFGAGTLVAQAKTGAPAAKPGVSHAVLAERMLGVMKDLGSTLEGIKDEAGAKAAEARLKDLYKKMFTVGDEMEKLGPPSPEVEKQMGEKIGQEVGAAMKKVDDEERRLGKDAKVKAVLDAAKQAALAPAPAKK